MTNSYFMLAAYNDRVHQPDQHLSVLPILDKEQLAQILLANPEVAIAPDAFGRPERIELARGGRGEISLPDSPLTAAAAQLNKNVQRLSREDRARFDEFVARVEVYEREAIWTIDRELPDWFRLLGGRHMRSKLPKRSFAGSRNQCQSS